MKILRCDICGYENTELHYHLFRRFGGGEICLDCYDKVRGLVEENKECFVSEEENDKE